MTTIADALRRLAEAAPDRPAITEVPIGSSAGRTVRTRLELEERTNRLARSLIELGVVEGSLVTVGLPNGIDFVETALAIWKCGATPQPISHRLPEREREAIIELAEPSFVVTAPIEVTCSDSTPLVPDRVAPAMKAPTSGGSTGRPKLIVSGEPALVDPEARPPFRASRHGTQLVPGPLYHNAPFVYATTGLLAGNHLVVMTHFDAATALRLIDEHGVDWVLLVPTMMSRMLKARDAVDPAPSLDSLNGILHLGAPCPPWVKEAWIEWIGGERVWELYSGTEAQRFTYIRGDEWMAHRGSVGRPDPGTMRILADDGSLAPTSTVGEIWMLAPARPSYQYIGAEARTDGGWESLGDLGSIDEDGYLYIADRRDDLILSGGANVYPAEVEAALEEHPAVRSCAVVPLPDPDLGQRVHAVVNADEEATGEELAAFVGERIARYKVPRSFEFVDEPVRDDAGKVRRRALVAEPRTAP